VRLRGSPPPPPPPPPPLPRGVQGGTRADPLPEADWQYFQTLAETLRACSVSGARYGANYCQFPARGHKYYRIYAIDQGGTAPVDPDDNACHASFCTTDINEEGEENDDGLTLVVFLGHGTVCLTSTCTGGQASRVGPDRALSLRPRSH